MGMQKCRFCMKPPSLEEGGAALPAVCNSWLQISYWNSISIEKCFSNKRSILVKSIHFELQISLYNKEASKLKRGQISYRKSQLFMGEKKYFISKNDGKQARNHPNHTPFLVLPLAWCPCVCVFKLYGKNWELYIVILIPI